MFLEFLLINILGHDFFPFFSGFPLNIIFDIHPKTSKARHWNKNNTNAYSTYNCQRKPCLRPRRFYKCQRFLARKDFYLFLVFTRQCSRKFIFSFSIYAQENKPNHVSQFQRFLSGNSFIVFRVSGSFPLIPCLVLQRKSNAKSHKRLKKKKKMEKRLDNL